MTASRRGRRWAAAGVCAALLAAAAWAAHRQQQGERQRARGAALFHGETPIVARLHGHVQPLPVLASRCSNCHETVTAAPASALAGSGEAAPPRPYASLLKGDALTTLRVRHGGPPSDYDATRFCELLRTGVDPAGVMIPGTMPRYEVTSADCADLWAYLRDEPD